jgi:hypothetical protein
VKLPGLWLAILLAHPSFGTSAPAAPAVPVPPSAYFRITVVDQATERGVPCVCLRTIDRVEYWTDSAGEAAFYEPELMGLTVFFYVESYGYTFRTNGFGFVGVQLTAKPGGHEILKLKRENIAERIYRCTGEGIYRDSELLALRVPGVREGGKEPVLGQDGGLMLPFRGKFMWSWGDTSLANFPLGVFKSTGATSEFPENGGLDPDLGVQYHYFRDSKGKTRPMVELNEKLVWPMAARVALDKQGQEHLLMNYCVGFDPRGGILEFDEQSGYFRHAGELPPGNPFPYLCSVVLNYRQQGRAYFAYGPWGSTRSGTDLASNLDSKSWEAFTCLKPGATITNVPDAFDRDANGRLRWAWRTNASILTDTEQVQFVRQGKLRPEERWYRPIDVNTGADWLIHDGSVCWNPYRGRWISLRTQYYGDSLVGEVLYFEADTPLGPWCYCQKVVTHSSGPKDNYGFYNVKQHSEFDKDDGRFVYFEGAFSQAFGSRPIPIPRYDYNEMMYKLDLADRRLFLPVPVYAMRDDASDLRTLKDIGVRSGIGQIICYAPDRPRKGTQPVFASGASPGKTLLSLEKPASQTARVAFYALPPDGNVDSTPPMTLLLYEYRQVGTGQTLYSTETSLAKAGYARQAKPVCRVWRAPVSFNPFELATDWEPVLSSRQQARSGKPR